ncbi:hypothetical protein N0V82_001375 [Gnomoniopsis sp. IMI 355080]|nr:hypothetical protein N0V82_001375 [Gnomoniopsis sp. IMI 355080]
MSQIPPHLQPKPYKIKIPRTAASYTPATMDMDLRSQLNIALIAKGHDKKIQEHLLYTLNSQPTNWPTQVQNRALALLRSGDVTTFPQLLKQVLEEVRKETVLKPTSSSTNGASNGESSSSVQVNGNSSGGSGKKTNGASNNPGPGPGEASNLHQNTTTSLALPQIAVDEAMKVTKEALLDVASFDEEKENGS